MSDTTRKYQPETHIDNVDMLNKEQQEQRLAEVKNTIKAALVEIMLSDDNCYPLLEEDVRRAKIEGLITTMPRYRALMDLLDIDPVTSRRGRDEFLTMQDAEIQPYKQPGGLNTWEKEKEYHSLQEWKQAVETAILNLTYPNRQPVNVYGGAGGGLYEKLNNEARWHRFVFAMESIANFIRTQGGPLGHLSSFVGPVLEAVKYTSPVE